MSTSKHGQSSSQKKMEAEETKALAAFFSSLGGKNDGPSMSSEAVQRIVGKLHEMFGDDLGADDGTHRDANGQLVNEEGLPVIEISEDASQDSTAPSIRISDPNIPVPLGQLSQEAREARIRERDRILDLLEEEERRDEAREREANLRAWRETMERKKAEQDDVDEELREKRKALRTQSASQAKKPVSSITSTPQSQANPPPTSTTPTRKTQKSVSFAEEAPAEPPAKDASPAPAVNWGDVIPAQLKRRGVTVPTGSSRIVKAEVVEHPPIVHRRNTASVPDSDDEDEFAPAVPPESDDEAPLDNEVELGVDMDEAMHQREIALEYYKRREALGTGAGMGALGGLGTGEKSDPWDQENVPPEASLASGRPKLSTSRFRASRVEPENVSITALLPEGEGLSGAVKMGKVENGQLVGLESDPEDETISKAKDALREGRPLPQPIDPLRATAVRTVQEKLPPSVVSSKAAVASEATKTAAPTPPTKKTSKFKAGRGQEEKVTAARSVSATVPKPATGTSMFVPTVIESPSFPGPSATQINTNPTSAVQSAYPHPASTEEPAPAPAKPPRPVMSLDVKESNATGRAERSSNTSRKISRFKAELLDD